MTKTCIKMALSLEFQNRVLYACSCSQLAPLSDIYFCRHCKVPRCQDCVFSTVESFSCHHCFEACSVTTELKAKKGRCNHCFQCPRCSSTLTTRSIIVPSDVLAQSEQSSDIPTPSSVHTPSKAPTTTLSSLKSPGGSKAYFVSCSHCKWSTRDVFMPDKRSPADFKDKVSAHQTRISELVLFCKEYAIQDIAEHDKVKKPISTRRPRTFGSLLDPTKFKFPGGNDSPLAKRRNTSQLQWDSNLYEKIKATPSIPLPPSDDLYTKPLCLAESSSMAQRLMDPSAQPSSVSGFLPHQLFLITKKLHRCNGCDHILIKAEMNPGSIRFKIQQIAWHVFPHVCILENPTLKVGEKSEVHLSISNPVNHCMAVSFNQCGSNPYKETISPCLVPDGLFVLTPNDDLGDLLDTEDEIKDDPEVVVSRHPGKLILKFYVTPNNVSESVKFIFEMVFSHKPMVEADQNYEETKVKVPVLVRLLKCNRKCD